jgi:hypothetical protein
MGKKSPEVAMGDCSWQYLLARFFSVAARAGDPAARAWDPAARAWWQVVVLVAGILPASSGRRWVARSPG